MAKPKKATGNKANKPLVTIRKSARPWNNPDRITRIHKELESQGFTAGPHVSVAPLAPWPARLFLHPKDRAYGILYDDAQSTWIDFFSVQSAGPKRHFGVTNAHGPLLGLAGQRPAYFACVQYANVSPTILYDEFKQNRPTGDWSKVSPEEVSDAYQMVCEADSQWQIEHVENKPDADNAMERVVMDSYARARAILEKDELHALRLLLADLALPKEANPKLPVSLTDAAGKGNLDAVKMFLDNGASLEEKTHCGTPLRNAAASGQVEVVRFLLAKGARGSLPEDFWGGPITGAAMRGHYAAVELLVDLASEEEKRRALEAAEAAGHDGIVTLLGGEPKPRKSSAKTKRASETLNALFDGLAYSTLLMGKEPDRVPLTGEHRDKGIKRALRMSETLPVKQRLGEKIGDARDTTLELAVSTGCLALVEAVLDANLPQEQLSRALMRAAGSGLLDICRALLSGGADPRHKNEIGWTPLICAVGWGRPDVVQLLLDAGADPRARTEGGETPMTAVCGPYSKQISDMLDAAAAAKGRGKRKPASSITYVKAKNAKSAAGRLGVADFRKFVGHPEWALAFVGSDPASVSNALSHIYPAWTRETALIDRTLKLEFPCVAVFRLKGHPWTVLIRSVGWLGMPELEGLANDATELSRQLHVRVVTYLSEDTSGCEGYEVYEDGRKVEEAMQGDSNTFKSSLRKKMPGTWKDFPESSFREMGIYAPCCALDDDGYETKLVVSGLPENSVESLDAFIVR